MTTASGHTVIVGGGLAGLAAAVALAERGIPVTLLESRPRLGGRASSFVDRTTGSPIDNCQHVSLGCCTNFQHFCRTVGLARLFRTESKLYFVAHDGIINPLAATSLPAPLHLLPSFARLSYLSRHELWRIAMALRALVRARDASLSLSFGKWLLEHRQSPAAVDRFWAPVLVSALSETLDRVDVASARKVFVDGFLANRDAWRVQIPTKPLGMLYGTHLTEWLAHRGAIIRMPVGAQRVVVESGRATGVALRGGEVIVADQVIVAVPHWLVLDLLPDECRGSPALADLDKLETAPISSVHLWFDRPVLFPAARDRLRTQVPTGDALALELPHVVLIDRLSQWVFNRTSLLSADPGSSPNLSSAEQNRSDHGHYYQVVISASREIASLSQQDVIARVVEELAEVFPRIDGANLLHSRMVTEHRAVFSVVPGSERFRPPQQSAIVNLQLAGDWTRTGWPSTMEGAVRSGYLAAENVLTHLGHPASLLQPDLPIAQLSRLLLGVGR